MKKYLLLLTFVLSLFATSVFSQTVYITKTGEKYHTENCRYLSKSKISINLSDAITKGYGACKVCKPSTSVKTTKSTTQQTKTKHTNSVKTPVKKSTKSVSKRCSGTTKAGNRCKRMTKSSNGRCYQH